MFILITLIIPAFEQVRMRMDQVNCTNNLRQLYVGATIYIQDNGHWPQVDPGLLRTGMRAYDEAWIEDFIPYKVGRGSWICPTLQRDLGGPDFTVKENYRADYVAMPFDSKRMTPFKWPNSPWFAERGNVHGNGNLVILGNGSVTPLVALRQTVTPVSSPKQ